jgi:hypothetical protein
MMNAKQRTEILGTVFGIVGYEVEKMPKLLDSVQGFQKAMFGHNVMFGYNAVSDRKLCQATRYILETAIIHPKKLGVSLEDVDGRVKSFLTFLNELRKKAGPLDSFQWAEKIVELGGTAHVSALYVLLKFLETWEMAEAKMAKSK